MSYGGGAGVTSGFGGYYRRLPTSPTPSNSTFNNTLPIRTSPPSRAPTASSGPSGSQMPYQPEAPQASGMIKSLRTAGEGLLDPKSPYAMRLKAAMTKGISQQGEARKRAAMLNAVRGGYGSGQSAELLDAESEISDDILEAIGNATAGTQLAAPELGARILSPALSGEIGLQGQRLSAFLTQQQLDAARDQAGIENQLAADRLAQEAMLRELSLLGGFF